MSTWYFDLGYKCRNVVCLSSTYVSLRSSNLIGQYSFTFSANFLALLYLTHTYTQYVTIVCIKTHTHTHTRTRRPHSLTQEAHSYTECISRDPCISLCDNSWSLCLVGLLQSLILSICQTSLFWSLRIIFLGSAKERKKEIGAHLSVCNFSAEKWVKSLTLELCLLLGNCEGKSHGNLIVSSWVLIFSTVKVGFPRRRRRKLSLQQRWVLWLILSLSLSLVDSWSFWTLEMVWMLVILWVLS